MEFELKKWDLAYRDDLAKYANNEKIVRNLRDVFPHPYSLKDAEWFIKDCIKKGDEKQLIRAIVINGHAVGSIGIILQDDVYRKSAELGYWLAEDFWGKGITPKAVKCICSVAFAKYDIVRIYAEIYARNTQSRKVIEKCGFKLEGTLKNAVYKNGELIDECIYALLKEAQNDA